MKQKPHLIQSCLLLLAVMSAPVPAAEPEPTVAAMTAQIETFNQKIAVLEQRIKTLESFKPRMATIMPEIAERFHVRHYAGEAGDWAVAAHELMELRHLFKISQHIDPTTGPMLQTFLNDNLVKLNTAIDHGNQEMFMKELDRTITNCNGCHAATGSPHIKVLLEARNSISLRHSHDLHISKPDTAHKH